MESFGLLIFLAVVLIFITSMNEVVAESASHECEPFNRAKRQAMRCHGDDECRRWVGERYVCSDRIKICVLEDAKAVPSA